MLEPSNTWPKGVLDWCAKYGHRCPRVLRSPETAPERPKYTVLSGHIFIWSHYLRADLRLCAFELRNAQLSTVLGLLSPQIPVEKG